MKNVKWWAKSRLPLWRDIVRDTSTIKKVGEGNNYVYDIVIYEKHTILGVSKIQSCTHVPLFSRFSSHPCRIMSEPLTNHFALPLGSCQVLCTKQFHHHKRNKEA